MYLGNFVKCDCQVEGRLADVLDHRLQHRKKFHFYQTPSFSLRRQPGKPFNLPSQILTMKFAAALTFLLSASTAGVFQPSSTQLRMTASVTEPAAASTSEGTQQDPLLIRAARGEQVERTPVWMMRQAGRHIKEYRDLCKKYPTFRERSEIPEVAVEVSLQPWRNYQTDGCILFSDILTPFPGMGVDFTIDEKLGPITEPIRSWDDAKKVRRS